MIVKTFAGLAGLIFLLLVIAQFIAFFNFTNIATVLAANLADFLQNVPLGGVSYIIIFVLVIFLHRSSDHRGGGEVGDLRAGVHSALHAARAAIRTWCWPPTGSAIRR